MLPSGRRKERSPKQPTIRFYTCALGGGGGGCEPRALPGDLSTLLLTFVINGITAELHVPLNTVRKSLFCP